MMNIGEIIRKETFPYPETITFPDKKEVVPIKVDNWPVKKEEEVEVEK